MSVETLPAEPRVQPSRTDRRPELAGHLLFAGCALATVWYLLYLGRHTSFFFDEWNWIQSRRGWRPGNFLVAHNGHFVALPVLLYHLLFATTGLRSYLPYRLLLMAFHVATCYALYRYARIRLGPLVAVLPAAVLLMLGAAFQNLLWPFQITLIGALTFGLAAFLLLDAEPTRRRDVLSCLCLLAAITCSGTGLAMLAGAAVRVVLRRQWRRWWVIAAPAVVFLGWYARYGRSSPGTPQTGGSPTQLWQYLSRIYQSAIGSLTGHTWVEDTTLALWLGVVILVAVVGRLAFELRRRALPVDLIAALAVGLVLWGLTALTRVHTHDYGASRYVYGGALVVLLALVETLRGLPLPRLAVGLLAVATAASVWTGLHPLRLGAKSLSNVDTYARADFAALQHSRPSPDYRPNPRLLPVVTAGGYLSAVRSLGSPAMPFGEIPGLPAGARADVDRVLRQAGNLWLLDVAGQPAGPADPVAVDASTIETVPVSAGCQLLTAQVAGGTLVARLALPAGGVTLSSSGGISLRVRRFGAAFASFGTVPAGQVRQLAPLADGSPVPWLVQLSAPGAVRLCTG